MLAASGDPQPYLDAMDELVDSEPATSTFISQLAAIVDDAEGALSGPELEIVQASASVTAESHDYWLTTNSLPAIGDSIVAAYPECHHQMNPDACVYDQSAPRAKTPPIFLLTSLRIAECYAQTMSPWRVLKWDLAGAIAGAVVGAVGGGAGAGPGAAGGALGASIAEAVSQGLDYLQCKLAE